MSSILVSLAKQPAKDICRAIAGIEHGGLFTIVYNQVREAGKHFEKHSKWNKKEVKEIDMTMKAVMRLTSEAYEDREKRHQDDPTFKAQGTYAVPVSENNLLYKHKTKEQFYIRMYAQPEGYKKHLGDAVVVFEDGTTQKTTAKKAMNWIVKNRNVAQTEKAGTVASAYNLKVENVIAIYGGEVSFSNTTKE
jgi:hypothetical protein